MGSKEVYSHYLLEVKRDYTKQLCNLLVPVMYEGILSLYTSAKNARKDVPMKMFQLVLSKVPEWNQHTITTEYNRIITKTNCEWINELITAVFISHAKILSSIKTKKKTKTLNLKIPNGDYFIHKAYIECARQFWKNPYLLYDEVNSIEYQRNLRDSEIIIEQCIEETIRKLLPIRNILQQYIAVDEDSSSSSSSDDESPDVPVKSKETKNDVNDNDVYNEEYITQSITEKGKKKLEQSVKKTLKTSVKTEDDDKFSNYSVSQEIPIKKKKTNDNHNHNTGIVNIVSRASNNNHVNNIDSVNEINITNVEGEFYKSLDPSNSIEISLNKNHKKKSKSMDTSVDIKNGSIELNYHNDKLETDNLSLHDFQLDFEPKKMDLAKISDRNDKISSDKNVNDTKIENEFSLPNDIVLNWDNSSQHDNLKKTNKSTNSELLSNLSYPHSLHEDVIFNVENENDNKSDIRLDRRSDKLSEMRSYREPEEKRDSEFKSSLSYPTSMQEEILLNLDNQNDRDLDKRSDKRSEKLFERSLDRVSDRQSEKRLDQILDKGSDKLSDKRSNLLDKLEYAQNAGNVLSEKKSRSMQMDNNQINLSVNLDNNKKNTNNVEKQHLDIELVDYVKKSNYDTDSVYNLSMDFDITDPKTFIASNASEVHKLPLSLVIDEKDIQNTAQNLNINKTDVKNIIINPVPEGGNHEPQKKTSLKKRNEKKSYSFF